MTTIQLLTIADIAAKIRRSESHTAQRVVSRVDFPRRKRLDGKGRPVWLLTEVDAWILAHLVEDEPEQAAVA